MADKLPKIFEDRIARITDEELEFRGWTREDMRARYLARMEQDKSSPQVGEMAPDFELELLDAAGKRTGQRVSLSGLRGKPVGLIFGSYT
ncbi:MAG: hypothetical protein OEO83_08595 [Alphaproteobacteria bacterium]|nr:hypothetical protein [Alphaproteobacteria bacterium]